MNQNYSAQPTDVLLFPETPVTYAGFWERFGAAFLDSLILSPIGLIMRYTIDVSDDIVRVSLVQMGVQLIISWLYYALQESGAAQATLGKRALGLQVTDLQGERINFGQATGRFFGRYLSTIILLFGYLMMLWDAHKQTLHDKMAGTLVIKKRDYRLWLHCYNKKVLKRFRTFLLLK